MQKKTGNENVNRMTNAMGEKGLRQIFKNFYKERSEKKKNNENIIRITRSNGERGEGRVKMGEKGIRKITKKKIYKEESEREHEKKNNENINKIRREGEGRERKEKCNKRKGVTRKE